MPGGQRILEGLLNCWNSAATKSPRGINCRCIGRRQNFFQPCTPLLQRFFEQQSSVLVEQIERRKTHGNFVLQPKIQLFSAQPFLQLRKWQRPRTVPSQNFSVQDQLTRQFCEKSIELR